MANSSDGPEIHTVESVKQCLKDNKISMTFSADELRQFVEKLNSKGKQRDQVLLTWLVRVYGSGYTAILKQHWRNERLFIPRKVRVGRFGKRMESVAILGDRRNGNFLAPTPCDGAFFMVDCTSSPHPYGMSAALNQPNQRFRGQNRSWRPSAFPVLNEAATYLPTLRQRSNIWRFLLSRRSGN